MESTSNDGFRNARFVSRVTVGIVLMTISFFLTLGLLQRFDLSYLYPFQGLSVIFITLTAAVDLEGKAKHATDGWRVADQRRDRARFNELEFRPEKNFKQILD